MKTKYPVLLFMILLIISFGFSGCVKVVSPKKAAAVEQAVASLSSNPAVQSLSEQVQPVIAWLLDHAAVQEPLKQIRDQSSKSEDLLEYDITVRIPVLTDIALSDLSYSLPAADFARPDPEAYQGEITASVAEGLLTYIQNAEAINAMDFTLHCTLVPNDREYTATFDENDLADALDTIGQPLQDILQAALDASDWEKVSFLHDAQEQILSAATDSDIGWKGLFFQNMAVSVAPQDAGGYLLTITLISSEKALADAAAAVEAAYREQYPQGTFVPFAPDAVEADFQSKIAQIFPDVKDTVIREITGTQEEIAAVTASFSSTLTDELDAAYVLALSSLTDRLNAGIVKQPAEPPQTGVLYGDNSGQGVTIETRAGDGAHYMKFERLSGTDLSENGQVALTAYIADGATLEVKLPAGNYKMKYAVGTVWYGEEDAFGPDGSYNVADVVMNVEGGKIYTLTLYSVDGGNMGTSSIEPGNF